MPQFLHNFGLGIYDSDENFMLLARHICEHGKLFRGYRCCYLYPHFPEFITMPSPATP